MFYLDYDAQSSHTSVIRANYVFLLETLDVKFSGLVDQLYSDQVVSAVEINDVTAEKTSFRANEKLLSALSRKSPQQFQLFLDALDNCGQRHIRNGITGPEGLLMYKKCSKIKTQDCISLPITPTFSLIVLLCKTNATKATYLSK